MYESFLLWTSGRDELPSLDLPMPTGWELFRSRILRALLSQMMRRCRELRLWFPEGLPTEEDRWQTKRHVAFCLEDGDSI